MDILVLVLAPLGDSLFTTPAIKALKLGYPNAKLDVITWEECKSIFAGNRNINRLIVCKGKGQLISELQEIREKKYDISIGLSNVGSYINYLVNAQQKVGFKSHELDWVYSVDIPDKRGIHAVDYCLNIVYAIGGKVEDNPVMEIKFSVNNRMKVINKLKMSGVSSNTNLIAIHPGGKYFTLKRWGLERFKKLIKLLDILYSFQIIIIGGTDDRELAEELIDKENKYNHLPINLAGLLSIKETAALLNRCSLFIGNDSFPMHLASAVGIPIVALFGPTNLANFHPYKTKHIVLKAELTCQPCFTWLGQLKQYLPEYLPDWASKCNGECMKLITVEEVLYAVKNMLGENLKKQSI